MVLTQRYCIDTGIRAMSLLDKAITALGDLFTPRYTPEEERELLKQVALAQRILAQYYSETDPVHKSRLGRELKAIQATLKRRHKHDKGE